jgi:beta-barrel assembly-enhancing protease
MSKERLGAWVLAGAVACGVATARAATPTNTDEASRDPEVALGQEVFNELKAKVELVESSPLYDVLLPVIEPIVRTAQPQYEHPFRVYLVHEAQPNAFATPGGNIYVTDSLLFFVRNREQLAGTLCHEVAHTIHHDSMTLLAKRQRLEKAELGAAILLGPTRAHLLALALLNELQSLGYSRDVEARADLTGSDICAAAGSNPWGLVWLFRDFRDSRTVEIPALLSDHPSDLARIDALEGHFRAQPAVFGSFNSDPRSATPFVADKKSPEVFQR